jgi:hypothetical protein
MAQSTKLSDVQSSARVFTGHSRLRKSSSWRRARNSTSSSFVFWTAPHPHTPPHSTHNPLHVAHNAQEVQFTLPAMQLDGLWMLTRCNRSGITRSVRAARPALNRAAFQPIKKNFAPAICSRFASTANAVKDGRVHQVIGAVVDGTSKISSRQQHDPRLDAKNIPIGSTECSGC